MASAMSVPQIGTPRRKFAVPSIGSMIHCRAESPAVPYSSPRIESPGRAASSPARMTRSTDWSASVTGVRSGFVVTTRSSDLKRSSEMRSASPARARARERSSAMLGKSVLVTTSR